MKNFKLIFFFALILSGNIFSQFYIDQEKIDELKISKQKNYIISEDIAKNKKIYLQQASSYNEYYSDVTVGFDKDVYKRGESIILTFKFGNESEKELEQIGISASCNISSEQVNLERTREGCPYFILSKGHIVQVVLNCPSSDFADCTIINIGFGSYLNTEGRIYIVKYDPVVKNKKLRKSGETLYLDNSDFRADPQFDNTRSIPDTGLTKKMSFSTEYIDRNLNNESIRINPLSSYSTQNLVYSFQQVNIHGNISYKDFFSADTKPVNNWLMRIYESPDNNVTPEDPFTEYPIQSLGGDGTFQTNIIISQRYYRVLLYLMRYSGSYEIYFTGRIETDGKLKCTPIISDVYENIYSSIEANYFFDQSSDVINETLRRCAHIGNRLDVSIGTNVGGDNLGTIQHVEAGTTSNSGHESFTRIKNAANRINYIQIGSTQPQYYDLLDGVIIHEHGHSIQIAINNFDYDYEAQGSHYIDQKGNTHLAYSEGWANFWACAVFNNSGLYNNAPYNFQLDLSTVNTSYIYSIINPNSAYTYLPGGKTKYDGSENEALVAGAFWRLKSINSLSSVWNGIKSIINDGSQNRAIRNMLEYFATNTVLINSFYSDQTRTEELGFGRNFVFILNTANLQNSISGLSDKTLIYLQNCAPNSYYNVTSKIEIDSKSFGIFGMSIKGTVIKGPTDQCILSIINPNANNDWFKVSDIQFKNNSFSIEAIGIGYNQPRLYVSRALLKGINFGGDAIIVNTAIYFNTNSGIFINSKTGAPRKLYIYNNVINNCNAALRFGNQVPVSGFIANNIFDSNNNGIAIVDANALPNSRSGVIYENNGEYPTAITTSTGLTIYSSTNIVNVNPNFIDEFLFLSGAANYKDAGINLMNDDAIFEDLFEDSYYSTKINWMGFYGGKQACTQFLPIRIDQIPLLPIRKNPLARYLNRQFYFFDFEPEILLSDRKEIKSIKN
ncbi:MAG: hypothetical protein CO127_01720 [Ignavibacteria bacterium CG_4_9_14_3_um_filter_36_18]|nr:hypothetical protein [Ignavibacteria bacterium]PJB01848.1 MAG: hypothetical protein CO127_01720 [Ignavibacteria bacterium CG_4_9_14_3_um_filter_36_18]